MLFRIPQNIIISSLIAILGGVFIWFMIGEELEFDSAYGLIHVVDSVKINVSKAILIIAFTFAVFVIFQINKENRFVEGNANPLFLFSCVGFLSTFVAIGSVLEIVAVLISLFSLLLVLQVHNQSSVLGILFTASLLFGVAAILYYPILLILGVMLLTVAFFRPFEIRNYVVILVGLLLPLAYFFSSVYLFNLNWSFKDLKWEWNTGNNLEWEYLIVFSAYLVLSIVSAFKVLSNRTKFVVRQRNQFLLISIFIILMVLLSILLQTYAPWVGVIPFTSLFIFYYYKKMSRKWILDLFTVILICALVWLKF